jgi:hypothetical protein
VFRSYQAQDRFGPKIPLQTKIAMTLDQASLGPPRPPSPACRAAAATVAKPPTTTTTPATVKASFDGFAFAAANAHTLPAGTPVFPQGSTVTGTAGCGADNNLFAVITYSGPDSMTDGALFGPNGTLALKGHPIHSGQNALFLLTSPPNGSYSMKLAFTGVNGPAFAPSLTLARSC